MLVLLKIREVVGLIDKGGLGDVIREVSFEFGWDVGREELLWERCWYSRRNRDEVGR